MKKFLYLLCCTLLFSFNAVSFESTDKKQNKKIETKCFVELYGGQQTIVYRVVNNNKFEQLTRFLVNKSVLTTLSDKKQKIYKVIECARLTDDFKSSASKSMESITAR